MRFNMAALMVAIATACAPQPYGSIPVDPVGLRERWRRACELGKAGDDGCTEQDGGLPEPAPIADSNGFIEDGDAAANEQPHDSPDAATNDGSFSAAPSGQSSYGPGGG